MWISYKQRYGITLVSFMDGEMIGLSSVRPGDKYDKNLGMAIALVKAHAALPSHEHKFAKKLEDVGWRKFQIPEEVMGKIVKAQLQYRQALGNVIHKNVTANGWTLWEDTQRFSPQMDKPECEVSELFGQRLVKSNVL